MVQIEQIEQLVPVKILEGLHMAIPFLLQLEAMVLFINQPMEIAGQVHLHQLRTFCGK